MFENKYVVYDKRAAKSGTGVKSSVLFESEAFKTAMRVAFDAKDNEVIGAIEVTSRGITATFLRKE